MLIDILFNNSLSFASKLIVFFTFSFAIVFALTIHEFAHAFTAYKLGDNTAKLNGRMTLNPMAHFDVMGILCFIFFGFGWAKPVPINTYNFSKIKRDTFLVSIAGVLTNLIVAFCFYPLAKLLLTVADTSIFLEILYYLCMFIFQINLVFAVFNLLPIYPLDGFNAISSQLRYDNPFVTFMQRYGMLILLIVIIIFSFTDIFNYLVDYVGYPIMAFWGLFF